jgi:ribosome-binding factor A
MKEGNRKVDEQARSTLANILLFEVSDPRLALVTITGCKVSFDRAYADVFVSCDPDRYDEVSSALASAKGHLRSVMARKLDWRVSPELRFHIDTTVDEAEKLTRFLNAEKERMAAYSQDEDAPKDDA